MDLNCFFNPKSVALIGATDRRGSVGLGLSRNLLQGKSKRKIFFVNPNRKKVLGKRAYPKIGDISEKIDLAIIAVPAKIVPQIAQETAEKRVKGAIVISAGFAETGKTGAHLQKELVRIFNESKIPFLGPNCLGTLSPQFKLNASFAPALPAQGQIALISQSGALIDSIIDISLGEKYGFSGIVSYGNEAGLKLLDFLEWFGKDKKTKVIALYLEGVRQGKEFMGVARKASRKKPILVLKAGKGKSGQKALRLHTSSLSTSARIYSAVFKQSGLIETECLQDLLDGAKALSWSPLLKGKIGIITNAGGPGVLAADYCDRAGINLAKLERKTIIGLKKSKDLPASCSYSNPLDIVGDARSQTYQVAIDALLKQKNIGGLIIIQTMQTMTDSLKNAKIITMARQKWPQKVIIGCFMGNKLSKPGIDFLEKNKIPNYPDPKRAVNAMKILNR